MSYNSLENFCQSCSAPTNYVNLQNVWTSRGNLMREKGYDPFKDFGNFQLTSKEHYSSDCYIGAGKGYNPFKDFGYYKLPSLKL